MWGWFIQAICGAFGDGSLLGRKKINPWPQDLRSWYDGRTQLEGAPRPPLHAHFHIISIYLSIYLSLSLSLSLCIFRYIYYIILYYIILYYIILYTVKKDIHIHIFTLYIDTKAHSTSCLRCSQSRHRHQAHQRAGDERYQPPSVTQLEEGGNSIVPKPQTFKTGGPQTIGKP